MGDYRGNRKPRGNRDRGRNEERSNMEELIAYIAKSLVNDPSQVTVRRRVSHSAVVIHLQVAPEDVGRVIGKEGRVANSMRSLLRAAQSDNRGKRLILEIE